MQEAAFGPIGQDGGDGNGQNPGPDDSANNSPFDRAHPLDGSNPHDGGGNDVGRGERDTPVGGDLNDGRRRGLGGKPVDGLHSHNLVAHGSDDPPPARCRSGRHGQGARHLDPERHGKFRGVQEMEPGGKLGEGAVPGRGKENQCDDAHGLLGIIGAMTESNPGGADELCLGEDLVDQLGPEFVEQHDQ